MKITYPREKREITLAKSESTLYVILGRGVGRDWWLMDFWNCAYMFKTYKEALKGAAAISKKMRKYEWSDPKAVIAKITL